MARRSSSAHVVSAATRRAAAAAGRRGRRRSRRPARGRPSAAGRSSPAARAAAARQRGVRRPGVRAPGRRCRPACAVRPAAAGVGPGQRDRLLVHHRVGETGLHQHVAEVVHVDEGREGRAPSRLAVQRRSDAQRARPERGEHQEAVDRQRRGARPRTAACGSARRCSAMFDHSSCARPAPLSLGSARAAGAAGPARAATTRARRQPPPWRRAARRRPRHASTRACG